MEKIIEVTGLTKKFKKFVAVDAINFSLLPGETLGFLGPNGAGKTTTIQMLMGILTPTSGSVKYFGREFKEHREEVLEQLNFSSTYTNLPWDLTVQECLTYTSYFYSIFDRKKRLKEIREGFQLDTMWKLKISDLSAGETTRVNLAKAFLNKPKILLLDEPTASLDPDIAHFVRELLLEAKKKEGLSILITSHNMSEVEEMCDRVLFIQHGKIVADDTPENLAKTVTKSQVILTFHGETETVIHTINENLYTCEKRGNHQVVIALEEQHIPSLLQLLARKNMHYNEIHIERPSLEDYFLHLSKLSR